MASFTDSVPQFKPYVDQLPVEAMVKVGMQKQAQYEQGVQKIQGQIDRVLGMDIANEADRAYTQSKLNELGNNLKFVAGGDFSNFQLVNSVGGMAAKIGGDRIVKEAVTSTAWMRKEAQYMEDAIKKGTSSVENRIDFNDKVNAYLSSPKAGTSFRERYVPYIDMDKGLREVASKIKESDYRIDHAFRRNGQGENIYYEMEGGQYKKDKGGNFIETTKAKGQVMLDDAVIVEKTKGISAQKILDNFYSSLNENEKQQLSITSKYHYRGYTKEKFAGIIETNYVDSKKILSDEAIKIAVDLKTNISDVEREKKEAQLAAITATTTNNTLEKKRDKELNELNREENIDDFKYKLYTQNTLTRLASDLSNESVSQEIHSNPYKQAEFERQKISLQVQKMRQDALEFKENYNQRERFHNDDQVLAYRKLADENPPLIGFPGSIPTGVKPPTVVEYYDMLGEMEGAIEAEQEIGKKLFTDDEIKLAGKDGAEKLYTNLQKLYDENPTNVTNFDQRRSLDKIRGLKLQYAQQKNFIGAMERDSKDITDELNKSANQVAIVDSEGNKLFSVGEILEVTNDLNKLDENVMVYIRGPVSSGYMPVSKNNDPLGALLKMHKGKRTEAIAIAAVKGAKGEPLTDTERLLSKNVLGGTFRTTDGPSGVMFKYRDEVNRLNIEKEQKQSDYILKNSSEFQTTTGTLNAENPKDKYKIDQAIANALLVYKDHGQVASYHKKDFNRTTIAALQKEKNTTYTIEKFNDGHANLILMNGEDTQIVPMSANVFSGIWPELAQTHVMDSWKYMIINSQNKTTNLTGIRGSTVGAINAPISGYSIPGLQGSGMEQSVRFDIEGALDGSANYAIRMYVNNGNGWKTKILNSGGFLSEDGVVEAFGAIGPRTIDTFLEEIRNQKQ